MWRFSHRAARPPLYRCCLLSSFWSRIFLHQIAPGSVYLSTACVIQSSRIPRRQQWIRNRIISRYSETVCTHREAKRIQRNWFSTFISKCLATYHFLEPSFAINVSSFQLTISNAPFGRRVHSWLNNTKWVEQIVREKGVDWLVYEWVRAEFHPNYSLRVNFHVFIDFPCASQFNWTFVCRPWW